MAVAAENIQTAIAVHETIEDQEARQRAARFIGACATESLVSFTPEITRPIESLYDAIQQAETNPEAYKLVETNVKTDIIERTIKSGHVIKVELDVDEAGNIQQHGQTMESVQANSLRYAANSPQMHRRTVAETTNAFRIEQRFKDGELDEYAFVVFSRAADDMSHEAMQEAGFFTDTMSTAIQITTARDGLLTTESAFVSGSQHGYRHDAQTLARVGTRYGIDYENMSATEALQSPVLIHKSLLPNGVVDIVKVWDESIDGQSFFGEAREPEDYITFKQQCLDREVQYMPKVHAIVNDLLAEASTIRDRLHATERLGKLSEKHMLQQAIGDSSIDARVFGAAAAHYIEASRRALKMGKYEDVINNMNAALKVAKSSSCPNGISNTEDSAESANDELGDCEFVSKQCPECKQKNVKTKVTKKKISGSCGCVVYK